jgi:hypothetical protein
MPLQHGPIGVLVQSISGRPSNAEASFWSQASPCGIFEGEFSDEVEASPLTLVFRYSYQSTMFRPIIEAV